VGRGWRSSRLREEIGSRKKGGRGQEGTSCVVSVKVLRMSRGTAKGVAGGGLPRMESEKYAGALNNCK